MEMTAKDYSSMIGTTHLFSVTEFLNGIPIRITALERESWRIKESVKHRYHIYVSTDTTGWGPASTGREDHGEFTTASKAMDYIAGRIVGTNQITVK